MSHVEVDEVFGFVGDIGAEVAADDAVPGGVVLLVELLLDVSSDIFFDVELFQSYVGAVDGVLLHLLVHVSMLDHGLPLSGRHYQLIKIKSNTHSKHPHVYTIHSLFIYHFHTLHPSSYHYYHIVRIMLTYDRQNKNKSTFIELKSANNSQ